jgi:S-formylglutathione hydrolase FrmB/uncharacterized membrane protein YoaK (UPF0700 family)
VGHQSLTLTYCGTGLSPDDNAGTIIDVLDASLLSGPVPWVVTGLAALAMAFLLIRPGRRWWLGVVPVVLVVAVALAAVVVWLVDNVWRPFPDPLPRIVLVAVALALAALGLAIAGFRRRRWPGRLASVLAFVLVALLAGQLVNAHFQQYPDVRSALGFATSNERPFGDLAGPRPVVTSAPREPLDRVWQAPDGMPGAGVVSEVAIPNTASGFPARPGWVYLPPAWLASPRAQLPVLVLLAGQPGEPRDWLTAGRLAQRMDAFARQHGGLAPVVVIPDDLGQSLANPLCLDSKLGQAATYLTVDVPAWIKGHLQVDPASARWAIGGLSHGATCSLQMAVNAPQVYPTFVYLSGQDEPTLGDRQRTVAAAFGGDQAAFRRVNPLDILATHGFPQSAGWFAVGADDTVYGPQGRRVYQACQAAGMEVHFTVLPGEHSWQVWGAGLEQSLPWLARRLELIS